MTSIRVLLATFDAFPGELGASASVRPLLASLRAAVHLVCLRNEAEAHQSRLDGAHIYRVRCEGAEQEQVDAFTRAVHRQLASEEYDIVHARGAIAASAFSSAPDRPKFIYELADDLASEEALIVNRHEEAIACADVVVTPSELDEETLARCGTRDVLIVPPSEDRERFSQTRRTHPESTRMIVPGRFSSSRDLACVLDALEEPSLQGRVEVLFYGDGSATRRSGLMAQIQRRELKNVRVVSRSKVAVETLFAASDIAVVPARDSTPYSFGASPEPIAALALSGVAMAVADVPAVRTLLTRDRHALFYIPGRPTALAEAVQRLLDPALRHALASSARSHALNAMGSALRQDAFAQIYESLAPGSQAADPWLEAIETEDTGIRSAQLVADSPKHSSKSEPPEEPSLPKTTIRREPQKELEPQRTQRSEEQNGENREPKERRSQKTIRMETKTARSEQDTIRTEKKRKKKRTFSDREDTAEIKLVDIEFDE